MLVCVALVFSLRINSVLTNIFCITCTLPGPTHNNNYVHTGEMGSCVSKSELHEIEDISCCQTGTDRIK